MEIILKDEFLPIYTHMQYSKVFKDSSIAYELSPDKKRASTSKKSGVSPMRSVGGTSSISQMGSSPKKTEKYLDMHKKTGVELKQSPSKSNKIMMKYINNYQDVGPLLPQKALVYSDLVELAKNMEKKDFWVKSDLRLIFALEDT